MMRPEEIALAILRKWWIIALAAIVAAGVAWAGTATQDKTYVVSTRVMAIAEPPDYWMDLYAKNRLASYRDLINNWEFVNRALQESGVDIDPGEAQGKLGLGHNPDSNIVQIVVTDTDGERAAVIANALADGFVSWTKKERANSGPSDDDSESVSRTREHGEAGVSRRAIGAEWATSAR